MIRFLGFPIVARTPPPNTAAASAFLILNLEESSFSPPPTNLSLPVFNFVRYIFNGWAEIPTAEAIPIPNKERLTFIDFIAFKNAFSAISLEFINASLTLSLVNTFPNL